MKRLFSSTRCFVLCLSLPPPWAHLTVVRILDCHVMGHNLFSLFLRPTLLPFQRLAFYLYSSNVWPLRYRSKSVQHIVIPCCRATRPFEQPAPEVSSRNAPSDMQNVWKCVAHEAWGHIGCCPLARVVGGWFLRCGWVVGLLF